MSDFTEHAAQRLVAVGHVEAQSARIWVRVPLPGVHEVRVWPRSFPERGHAAPVFITPPAECDGTHAFTWPDDFEGAPPLQTLTPYDFEIADPNGNLLARGGFETSPAGIADTPDVFSLLVASCNQPFDDHGMIRPASQRQLECAATLCDEYQVKRAILLGDQMYADYPRPLSLFDEHHFRSVAPPGRKTIFDCTRAEVRRIYQQRYRTFWQSRALQRLQTTTPTYAVPDDHEICDNFGSAPVHAGPAWRNLRQGALDACFDYQALRVWPRRLERPESMHCAFEYGPVAVFIMDLRSQKTANADRIEMFGQSQFSSLRAFLASHGENPILVLALSVPLVYFPDWLTNVFTKLSGESSDAADRWSYEKATASRDRLVELLSAHQEKYPQQKLILLGGDVHCGVVSQLQWIRPRLHAVQLVSSPVSNLESKWFRRVAEAAPRVGHQFDIGDGRSLCRLKLLEGEAHPSHNPYSGLNMGIVQVRRHGTEWMVRLRLVGHQESDEPRPVLVYSTAEF